MARNSIPNYPPSEISHSIGQTLYGDDRGRTWIGSKPAGRCPGYFGAGHRQALGYRTPPSAILQYDPVRSGPAKPGTPSSRRALSKGSLEGLSRKALSKGSRRAFSHERQRLRARCPQGWAAGARRIRSKFDNLAKVSRCGVAADGAHLSEVQCPEVRKANPRAQSAALDCRI